MDEENLGDSLIVNSGECELGESSVIVGGEREKTASMEDEGVAMAVGGRMESGQQSHEEVGHEPELVGEAAVEIVNIADAVAEDGGNEVIASEEGDLTIAMEEEGANRVDEEREGLVSEGVNAPVSDGSQLNEKGGTLVVDSELAMKTEEEIAPATDAKLETDATDFDDILLDPQLRMKTEDDRSVVDSKMEVVDAGAGYDHQLSELQTDAGESESNPEMEGTEHERNLGDNEHVEASGGDSAESEEGPSIENYAETAIRSDTVSETVEEVEEVENSEFGGAEEVEEEKVDPDVVVDVPVAEVETDGNSRLGNECEQEQLLESSDVMEDVSGQERNEHAEDKAVITEESQIGGTEMVEDENAGAKIDEHLNEAEFNEDVLVKADLLAEHIKLEEESKVESEMMRTPEVDHLSEDVEVENEMGTNEDVLVKADLLVEHIKLEEESKVDHLSEDVEVETEVVTISVDSKYPDSDVDETAQDMYDSPDALQDEEDETTVPEEETGAQDTEMETETDMAESEKTSAGKRKRAKLSKSPSITKATAKGTSRKTVGEDVCFICFDGGELVLCDRRGCPKAYHPSCVNRDESFFKSKGRWNCGWHLCSICEKNARYMCYTCTFSLCKSCTKDASILCVRGNKGFCDTCMRTVMLIESNEQADNNVQVDFDDKSSWEYLFKDYYIELKAKLSLSSVEISEAKNPWKGGDMSGISKTESPGAQSNEGGSDSDNSIENLETIKPKRRKLKRQLRSHSKRDKLVVSGDKAVSSSDNTEWASRELLEFVSHMKNGDISVLSQFNVQELLLEYIKRQKLRDPRRKSQIVCDARLENLFGKPRVGHFEMLKLLESHFLVRDEQNDDLQGSVVDTENDQLDVDASPETLTKSVKDKKRKSRKKGDNREPQSNLDDFAAIDMHNIGLIYLKRKLIEDLLEDTETFSEKVIGTFVRIRIFGSNQKQDLYRLVQVVGTSKTEEPYKVGKRTTDIMVEILNLDKTEILAIDTLSNQEFTEDECKRLRQSIKCELINPLTVGGILDKTMEIQVARVNDWLESETLRLGHLRDRASDLGRRKELRECVEKLQLLKSPEERRRRLEEIPEIHADPKMNPNYESEDNDSDNEEARRDAFMKSRGSGFSRRGRGPVSPGRENYAKDSWSSAGKSTPSRNPPGNTFSSVTGYIGETVNENSWNLERDKSTQELNNFDKPNTATKSESAEWAARAVSRPETASGVASLPSQGPYSATVAEPTVKINESEKIWQYQDPSGKVQGPFSIVQLRKWNNTGYFPANLKIWRVSEKQENSVLLVDALAGKFPKELPAQTSFLETNSLHTSTGTSSHKEIERSKPSHSSVSLSNEKWSGNDTVNFPSPTPKQSNTGWSGKGEASHLTVAVQSPSVNGVLPSPTAVLPNLATHSSNTAPVLSSVVQNTNFSLTPNSPRGVSVSSAVPMHSHTTLMNEPHVAPMHSHPSAAVAVQPPQTMSTQNLPTDPQVWGSGAQSGQAQGYGWAPSNVKSSSGSFLNPVSGAGVQPDVWRPPTQINQPNMHSPTTPNVPWGVGLAESNTPTVVRPQNPNVGWGGMQGNLNMGWVNPANTNVAWAPAMQGPPPPAGNTSGWVPPPGGNMQGMVPGNANPGWGATQGWVAPPVSGPTPGGGWAPPTGNVGAPQAVQIPGQVNANQNWPPWGGEQSHGGGQFSGPRGGGGRDSGFGGGQPWNRQPSFGGNGSGGGGGGGGGRRKGDMLCPYNGNGRCRKGSRCDYLHT